MDIGGEEPHPHGFCPVEFFVPRFRRRHVRLPHEADTPWIERESLRFETDADECLQPTASGWTMEFGPWESLDIGFVAGCHWGDDTSWKLQVFNLSAAAAGRIRRSERFGHVQLGDMPLASAVKPFSVGNACDIRIRIVREETRDVMTGSLIDPCDE